MTDFNPLDFLPNDPDVGKDDTGPTPAGDRVDERDTPKHYEDVFEPDRLTEPAQSVRRHPMAVADPLPVISGPGRILHCRSLTLAASDTKPVFLGLDVSTVQAARIAYLILHVNANGVYYAGDESAMPTYRALLGQPNALARPQSVRLDHVGGVWVWPVGVQTTVSATVVGR